MNDKDDISTIAALFLIPLGLIGWVLYFLLGWMRINTDNETWRVKRDDLK